MFLPYALQPSPTTTTRTHALPHTSYTCPPVPPLHTHPQYVKVDDSQTGETRVVAGPALVFLGPYEAAQEVGGRAGGGEEGREGREGGAGRQDGEGAVGRPLGRDGL